MRYEVNQELKAYNGTALIDSDGKAASLKKLIEMACIGADAQEFATLDKKLQVHRLLVKVYNSEDIVELSAEEITLIKQASAKVLSIPALGALVDLLENPPVIVAEVKVDEPS